ncbi:cell adhesion molecule 3-like isoform X1 [Tachypleus tridentatus]|uniref:cell adhesion molecule 3-like isoform X1 n=1 Tax=Tachypleus tridentatus TaxID=6853 RepID=UPI003FD36E7E
MLDVPSPTVVGQEVELTCSFDLNGDTLYSVKWYKDDVEFYRFVPNDWPPGQFLPLSGVRVDLSKSKEQSVYIRTVTLETAGVYKCEVSTEAPVFDTVSAKKEMKVYVLPTEGPKITGRHMKYRVGDTVIVNCTSAKSKPAASLTWYINDEKVGADYDTVYSTILHDDGLEVSCLSLRFLITSDHFTNGNMRLKCEASIPRVRYTMSDEALVVSEQLQHVSGLQIRENLSKIRDTAAIVVTPVRWIYCLLSLLSLVYSLLSVRI